MEDLLQPEATTAAGAARAEEPGNAAPTISVAGAEPEIVPDQENDQLKITLGEFEGPLDLLLYLIRQEQINIYDIPLGRITEEYFPLPSVDEGLVSPSRRLPVMAAQLSNEVAHLLPAIRCPPLRRAIDPRTFSIRCWHPKLRPPPDALARALSSKGVSSPSSRRQEQS